MCQIILFNIFNYELIIIVQFYSYNICLFQISKEQFDIEFGET